MIKIIILSMISIINAYEFGEGGIYPFLANMESLSSVYEPTPGTYLRFTGYKESDIEDLGIVSFDIVDIQTGTVINSDETYDDYWEHWIYENEHLYLELLKGREFLSFGATDALIEFCRSQNEAHANVVLGTNPTVKPRMRPADLTFWTQSGNPHDILIDNKNFWRQHGNDTFDCRVQMRVYSENLLNQSSWANTTAPTRASKVHEMSERILAEVREEATKTGENAPTSSSYRNYTNPNYIDPLIDSETMSCIAMYETRHEALFNPFSLNYTYCSSSIGSTAFGLGQITRTTIDGMINNSAGNLMPFLRESSEHLRQEDNSRDIHRAMATSPELQIESMIYILNEKIKYFRWQSAETGRAMSEDDLIREMIIKYDQDGQSSYITRVLNCRTCLAGEKSPYECYVETLHSDDNLFETLPWE